MTGKKGHAAERKVQIKDILEIYKDPETEEHVEGFARVWDILSETDEYYTLIVSFLGDPHERRVPRQYRKKEF